MINNLWKFKQLSMLFVYRY